MSDAKEKRGRRRQPYKPIVKIVLEIILEQAGGKITDVIEVSGVIDTRLTCNCMRHEMVEVLRLQPVREDVTEQISDRSPKTLQRVRLEGFRLGGKSQNPGIGDLNADFLIVQNESMTSDLAFGTDFLQDHGAVLDFANGTITLGGRKWNMHPMDL